MYRFSTRPSAGAASSLPAAGASADGPIVAAIQLLAPIAALTAGVVTALAGPPIPTGEIVAMVGLPTAIVALVLLGGRRPRLNLIAALCLDIEAVLAGTFLVAGLAFAVILPVIGVALVQPQLRDRELRFTILAAGLAAIAGVAASVLVGPASDVFSTVSPVLTIGSFALVVAFGLALDWRATRHMIHAIDTAEGEVAAHGRTEAELGRTADLLSAIVQSSPVATQAFDLDRSVTIWNPASERVFGWSAEEVIGRPLPAEMTPPDERPAQAVMIERTIAGGIVDGERVRRLTKDSRVRWIDVYAAPLRDRHGDPIGVAGQLVDVTERVQLEAQLLQAQKMEAIGLLASGLAHDFNNTLTAAGGLAALIEDAATDEQIRTDARGIVDVVDRARKLTRQLLTFARASDAASRSVDVRAVVTGIVPLIRQLIGPDIEVELDLPDRPMIARLDAGQLEQALINLAVNARDAMPAGGVVRIAVAAGWRSALDEDGDGPLGAPFVEISVRDTGTGMSDEVRERIFEPFFTTKGPSRGSGLGLAMVKTFAGRAGGEVSVESTLGKGTTFAIRLPEARSGLTGAASRKRAMGHAG